MRLEQVNPNYVCQLWPKVEERLAAALKHAAGECTVDQLKLMLVRGEQTLLVFVEEDEKIAGALTVWFSNLPNMRVAYVTGVGGRGIANTQVRDLLRQWCFNNGATHIRGAVRPSVARLCREKLGFEQRYIVVEQPL